MSIEIIEVKDKKDLKDFINLPYELYKNHPIWVPPLKMVVKREFDVNKNNFFNHADPAFFLARKDGKAVGRIAAFVNHGHLKKYKDDVGFFGSYESIEDTDVSRPLFSAASRWLTGKGLKHMRGPYNFTSQSVGFIIIGFDQPHTVLSPYNPPYYNELAEDSGLKKIMDTNAYYGDSIEGYVFPERFQRHYERLSRRHGVRVRTVDLNNIYDDVRAILTVANQASARNWGFVPVESPELGDIVRDFKMFADPDGVLLVEKDDQAIGYAVALPDVNIILKKLNGRLFPFGILRLKFGVKRLREYRLWGLGFIPKFQGKALDSLLYYHFFKNLYKKRARVEASWVLETNKRMNQAIINLGFHLVKRFRIYQKPLS
jgi:hypothetical protein